MESRRWVPSEERTTPKRGKWPSLPFPIPIYRDAFMILLMFAFGSILQTIGWLMTVAPSEEGLQFINLFGGFLCILSSIPVGTSIGSAISYLTFWRRK